MNATKFLEPRQLIRSFGSFALLIGLSACGGGGDPPPPAAFNVVLSCASSSIGVYAQTTCSATVKDQAGAVVSPQPEVFFSSSDENVVKVNVVTGVAVGYAVGSATITAQSAKYGKSLAVKLEVTSAGAFNCGTFTISKDASGADYNGLSTNPIYAPVAFGTLSTRTVTCRGDQSVAGNRVLRTLQIDMGYGSLVAGQSYPALIEFLEEQVNVSQRDWRNTKGTSDVRLESITGDQYRFTYSGIVLQPYYRGTTGNLTISGDFTATVR